MHGIDRFCQSNKVKQQQMDKAIGYAVKNKINLAECSVYTSGRVPLDMAMKAIMAGVPVLVSKGMPTQDTIQLVNQYKLTLISGARRDLVRIYADF
jgi:FdhD protein